MRHIPGALEELDAEQEIVVICHHGIRSRQVALMARLRHERAAAPQFGDMLAQARTRRTARRRADIEAQLDANEPFDFDFDLTTDLFRYGLFLHFHF